MVPAVSKTKCLNHAQHTKAHLITAFQMLIDTFT